MAISMEKAAETFEDVTKDLNLSIKDVIEDTKKLLEDVYVDDGTTGGSKREVDRMFGTKLLDGSFLGIIPRMMKKVGLKHKIIVSSHPQDQKLSQSSLREFLAICMIP